VKTERESVAGKYAEAMLSIASKTKDLPEKIANDLKVINQTVKSAPDLKLLLGHPNVSNEQKKDILSALFVSKIDDLTIRLLGLLTDKRRLLLLPQIESQYRASLNELRQVMTAQLIGSDPLANDDIANVKARLSEHLGRNLELEVSVEKALIGGFILRLGDQVIDGSLKGKLRMLEKTLLLV